MTKIRCTLPNASEEMNGIKFAVDAGGGMVSVDAVPEDLAAIFLSVPGFMAEGGKAKKEDDPEALAEAQRIKDQKAADAQAAKDKKASDALAAKEKKAADKLAAKGKKPAEETAPVDPAATGTESTGTESTAPADKDGKPEGEV